MAISYKDAVKVAEKLYNFLDRDVYEAKKLVKSLRGASVNKSFMGTLGKIEECLDLEIASRRPLKKRVKK
jgi:hypothetical protein